MSQCSVKQWDIFGCHDGFTSYNLCRPKSISLKSDMISRHWSAQTFKMLRKKILYIYIYVFFFRLKMSVHWVKTGKRNVRSSQSIQFVEIAKLAQTLQHL